MAVMLPCHPPTAAGKSKITEAPFFLPFSSWLRRRLRNITGVVVLVLLLLLLFVVVVVDVMVVSLVVAAAAAVVAVSPSTSCPCRRSNAAHATGHMPVPLTIQCSKTKTPMICSIDSTAHQRCAVVSA